MNLRIWGTLRDGSVLGVVSTNALELGIDIGALDVSVMLSYPGRSRGPRPGSALPNEEAARSTWQQAGRSGRRGSTSAAVLVLNSTPLNQFIGRNSEYFFGASAEEGRINPEREASPWGSAKPALGAQPAHPDFAHQVRGVRAAHRVG